VLHSAAFAGDFASVVAQKKNSLAQRQFICTVRTLRIAFFNGEIFLILFAGLLKHF
jgi:hypothetical protein